jgi:sugar lactone lactonase YvrE
MTCFSYHAFGLRSWALFLALLLSNVFSFGQTNNAGAYTFTTFAGYAGTGSLDGVGNSAEFNNPQALAAGSDGNIYVADTGNFTVRQIAPSGVVTTIGGFSGAPGAADGLNSQSRFFGPVAIAVDGRNRIFVVDAARDSSDTWNEPRSAIKEIQQQGTNWVTKTLVGGPAKLAGWSPREHVPFGIAIPPSGNLYVCDSLNAAIYEVREERESWRVDLIAGQPRYPLGQKPQTANSLVITPTSICTDVNGALFITENSTEGTGIIKKLTGSNGVWTLADTIQLNVVSPSPLTLWYLGIIFGTYPVPRSVAVSREGIIYAVVTDTIQRISSNGTGWTAQTLAGGSARNTNPDGTGSSAQFDRPQGIAINAAGDLFVTDGNSTIRKVTAAGAVSTFAGAFRSRDSIDGTGPFARFFGPSQIAVDRSGNLYAAETGVTAVGHFAVRKITPAGQVSTLAGGTIGYRNGVGTDARFGLISGLATDSQGNVFVADQGGTLESGNGSSMIRMITPAQVVSTIAGMPNAETDPIIDGSSATARFGYIQSLCSDSEDNLYAGDAGCIRKISRAGSNWMVTTIAGLPYEFGASDGIGTNASFGDQILVAATPTGDLVVADYNLVRTVTKTGTNWLVRTIAGKGSGTFLYKDGPGTVASFGELFGITADLFGNIFVSDGGRILQGTFHTIRKVERSGNGWTVSTIGGRPGFPGSADGAGDDARFLFPNGLAADSRGTLYVADFGNNVIRRGGFAAYTPAKPMAYSALRADQRLKVTLIPAEAHGQWRFPWELGWRESDVTVSNLVAGNYAIEFKALAGYLSLSTNGIAAVANGFTSVTNEYLPTFADLGTNRATLIVGIAPNFLEDSAWRFLGETAWRPPGTPVVDLSPDTYFLEFRPLAGYVKPATRAVQIYAGQTSAISANYILASAAPTGISLPQAVPAEQINDTTNYPFGFNGRLLSDVGFGSGVAVQTNVVLTAAHLVFNDQILSYVSHAHWFFRQDTPLNEPRPQEARGFYLLSGYAAQRANDLASGYSPDQSTPPSRNLDVAALYFLEPVAGGGYGGYLPSDAVPNAWLSGTALKMLVGYPADGSQFGDASIVPGKIYRTEPQPYPLSLAFDPVPGKQQVYTASWLLSYPGNSGGPLYVQLNGYYYPAAVYLGTLFSGSQPYASVVRAIDSSVTNLIELAALQGDSGTNNTGGGVITFIPSVALSAQSPGYVQVKLGPLEAVKAGAAWRLDSTPANAYGSDPKYTLVVTSSNAAVVFKPTIGWDLPANQTVTITPGRLTVISATYTPAVQPILTARLVANKSVEISWPATAVGFTLQSSDDLSTETNWKAVVDLPSLKGTSLTLNLPVNMARRFYRLVRPWDVTNPAVAKGSL